MRIENVKISYEVSYLPNKKCRKERTFRISEEVCIEVREPSPEDFPVAFLVNTPCSVHEGARDYHDFKGAGEYKIITEEIRMYDGKLYKAVRVSHGAAVSTLFETPQYIAEKLGTDAYGCRKPDDYTEDSIIVSSSKETEKYYLQQYADYYLIFEGKVWEVCGEPYYTYNTFGLGNNHGGTAIFIKFHESDDYMDSKVFNALDKEKAIEHAILVAQKRRDTESVKKIQDTDRNIEVLIPEAVKIRSRDEYEKEIARKKAFEEKEVAVSFTIEELRTIAKSLEKAYEFDLEGTVRNIIASHEKQEEERKNA